jgi:hypothetical protein
LLTTVGDPDAGAADNRHRGGAAATAAARDAARFCICLQEGGPQGAGHDLHQPAAAAAGNTSVPELGAQVLVQPCHAQLGDSSTTVAIIHGEQG